MVTKRRKKDRKWLEKLSRDNSSEYKIRKSITGKDSLIMDSLLKTDKLTECEKKFVSSLLKQKHLSEKQRSVWEGIKAKN